MPAVVQSDGEAKVKRQVSLSSWSFQTRKQSQCHVMTQVQSSVGAHQRARISVRIRLRYKWQKIQIAVV